MRKRIVSSEFLLSLVLLASFVTACDRTEQGGPPVVEGGATVSPAPGYDDRPTAVGFAAAAKSDVASAPPVARDNAASGLAEARQAALSLGGPIPPLDPSGAMLIRSGQASVEVRALDGAVTALRRTAGELGGFVANTSIVGGREEHRTATLEIRVPGARFDAVIAALGALGKVESVSASVQDVGDEYVDLGARAANARHMEARLVEMLAQRTGKLSEVLTVEQELRRVREEIERYEARLKWLERRTALSSISIALHEPVSVLDPRGPSPIDEAFAEAWRRTIAVIAWSIASLGILLPLGVVFAGLFVLARRLRRRAIPSGVAGA